MKCLLLCGVLVHIILLMAVFDIYFVSPILHIVTSHRAEGTPPSKRIVLFVADGLRAESVFGEHMQKAMPYLKSAIENQGTWGIAHTQMPTESRPGHVAMLAGFYEDPSAITKGWQANPVDFDSIINQSTNAWSWGSPDIVNLFTRDNLPHIHVDSYKAYLQDFAKKSTSKQLDEWVFRKVEAFIKTRAYNCGRLCDSGNILFLHLLGMDVVGHSTKPNSKDYNDNIAYVDLGIKNLTNLIDGFFGDNLTTYVFTSDHGMTDWGAHGDGSEHETQVPFVAWGAGVARNVEQQDIQQVDIPVLLATFLGINIPVNSFGVLQLNYIKASSTYKTKALFANALQLMEQYNTKRQQVEKSTFSVLYKPFKHEYLLNNLVAEIHDSNDRSKILQLINMSLDGLKYYNYYHQVPLLFCTVLGFLQWMVFLILKLFDHQYNGVLLSSGYIYMSVFVKIVVIYFCYAQQFPLAYYVYYMFPFGVFDAFMVNSTSLSALLHLIRQKNFLQQLVNPGMLYLTGLLLLSAAFYNRMALSAIHLFLSAWIFRQKPLTLTLKIRWFLLCVILSYFPTRPAMQTSFVYEYFYGGLGLWALVFGDLVCGTSYLCKRCSLPNNLKAFIFILLFFFVCASLNVINIEASITEEKGLPLLSQLISWALLLQSVILPILTPVFGMARFAVNAISLISTYTLFAVDCETCFAAVLVYLLFNWILVECHMLVGRGGPICCLTRSPVHRRKYHTRTIFVLYVFVVTAMFASGNTATFSSFDPLWVRGFVTVFSPFTMATLIIIKLAIPIMLVLCAFSVIVTKTGIAPKNVFLTMTLFSDVLVVIFLFQIRTDGSWKDIGLSLSRFIIAEVMTICLMLLYVVANFLVSNSLFPVANHVEMSRITVHDSKRICIDKPEHYHRL